jgi:hypothetical protein
MERKNCRGQSKAQALSARTEPACGDAGAPVASFAAGSFWLFMLYSWAVAVTWQRWMPAGCEHWPLPHFHIETFFTMFTRRLFKME